MIGVGVEVFSELRGLEKPQVIEHPQRIDDATLEQHRPVFRYRALVLADIDLQNLSRKLDW
jgi:hypothetical protein